MKIEITLDNGTEANSKELTIAFVEALRKWGHKIYEATFDGENIIDNRQPVEKLLGFPIEKVVTKKVTTTPP